MKNQNGLAFLTVAGSLAALMLIGCTKGGGDTAGAAAPPTATQDSLVIATSAPVPRSSPKQTGGRRIHLDLRKSHFAGTDGNVDVADIVITGPIVHVKVVDVLNGIRTPSIRYRSYSLREVIAATHASLAVTGAAGASLTLPAPLGLVIDSGKTVSPLDRSSEFATGVFCVRTNGTADILRRERYNSGQCTQAMQSGPVVIEGAGKIGIEPQEVRRLVHERLVIGIDDQRSLHVISTSNAHLYDLARFMMTSLKITAALNLGTGTVHSAVWVDTPATRFTQGNLDGGIPSAIIDAP